MLRAMVTVSAPARAKILDLLQREGRDLALRFAVEGRGPGGFRYRLGFVPPSERTSEDTAVEAGGFQILIDAASAPRLKGASMDYVETLSESGFKIDNPNSPWSDPMAQAVQRVIDDQINPAIASHGGHVVLVDVRDGAAHIEMHGGCQGCGMAQVTLREGIEVAIREAVPGIREIVDATNHAGGANPYFASDSGHSPLAG